MAYSELIKKIEKTREYMRRFYVYGFGYREQYKLRSARSYDNERRRMESWMSDYVSSRRDVHGKTVYLSVDGREIVHNPLYKIFKAKSFTSNDILLHFFLMDVLTDGKQLTVQQISNCIESMCFEKMEREVVIDDSTLRKKIKEYEKLGLISHTEKKKRLFYQRTDISVNLEEWGDALSFFSETAPAGVIGSFVLDKLKYVPDYFRFKHHFLLHALDSEILTVFLKAMMEQKDVRINIRNYQRELNDILIHPMKIYVSVQNGRQYLLAWDYFNERPFFYRFDNIVNVEIESVADEKEKHFFEDIYQEMKDCVWGVSLGDYENKEHLEMTVFASDEEYYIPMRLEREKRNGTVVKIDDNLYRFSVDVYDANELIPWIRTFMGRVVSLTCTNQKVTEKFQMELEEFYQMYGGEENAV